MDVSTPGDVMASDPGITDIARQLAEHLPTGATDLEQTVQDWRVTIYNAKATASMRPLADLIDRSTPEGVEAPRALADVLRNQR
jgi:hypothetical protein